MAIQETHPGLLTVTATTIEDRLIELAKNRRTRVHVIGHQHLLFESETVPMVEVICGAERLTVALELARQFGLSPR